MDFLEDIIDTVEDAVGGSVGNLANSVQKVVSNAVGGSVGNLGNSVQQVVSNVAQQAVDVAQSVTESTVGSAVSAGSIGAVGKAASSAASSIVDATQNVLKSAGIKNNGGSGFSSLGSAVSSIASAVTQSLAPIVSRYTGNGGEALDVGYFITSGNNAMTTISNKFDEVYRAINNDFEQLRNDFRREWIGPDEIAFEAKLIDRIDLLKLRARNLVVGSIATIDSTLRGWIDFQDRNTIDGSSTGATYLYKLIQVPIVNKATALNKIPKEFGAFDSLGLKSPMSADVLKTSLTSYLNKVGERIKEIYEDVRTSNGFFGENQIGAINIYLNAISEEIKNVQTSIPDLEQALSTLTTTAYRSHESSVSEQMSSASKNAGSVLPDITASVVSAAKEVLGSSRWFS